MKKLLNTLYITTPERYLALDGETVLVKQEEQLIARVPLHNLDRIMTFGYTGASPALMGKCAQCGIELVFMSRSGKFLARVEGESSGNVLLRREQYRIADDPARSLAIARNIIAAKLYNSRWSIERTLRDHSLRINTEKFRRKSAFLQSAVMMAETCQSADELRGIEGEGASVYFSVFDEMILQQKEDFSFHGRSKRPPMDNVNAMLSFAYSLCTGMCTSALEAVGLDAYVGFLHTDRPGRRSLALDLVEEFRSWMCDRFVLSLINRRMIGAGDFVKREDGAVLLTDEGRRSFLSAWQNKKQEELRHPFLDEKITWGMVPYAQALLLARYIRKDMDAYPPFLWK